MFERIKDCVCHPRYIGKYHKDHIGIVLLTIVLFFVLCVAMQGVRSYTDSPFDQSIPLTFTSYVIQNGEKQTSYDAEEKKILGESFQIDGNGFILVVLPLEDQRIDVKLDTITVVLHETTSDLYYGSRKISSFAYQDMKVSSFSFASISKNQAQDIYHYKLFIETIFNSSKLYFQSYGFIQSIISSIVYYLICCFFSYILSIAINPTINRGVRAKLCFYDGCVFFIGEFFAFLFNVDILVYFALALPLVYTLVTFRHIVKVVIRK